MARTMDKISRTGEWKETWHQREYIGTKTIYRKQNDKNGYWENNDPKAQWRRLLKKNVEKIRSDQLTNNDWIT